MIPSIASILDDLRPCFSRQAAFECTRSQGQNVRVDQLLLEPGEIGLLPIKEAADRIDQNMVGRRCSQTTGLFE